MKQRIREFTIAFLLLFFGFANLMASQSETSKFEEPQSKSLVEIANTPKIQTSNNDSNELSKKDCLFYDTELNEVLFLNFNFQFVVSFDSISTIEAKNYIQKIYPVIRKIDSNSIDMIEIL